MNRIHFMPLLAAGLFSVLQLYGQKPVDVVESTLKVSAFGEEVFYYGFAEGDQLIFNFQEMNDKELKEVEITELPASSKFLEYKTKKIENKTINISRTAVYKFRFTNSGIGIRLCKFKIQRIPASAATQNFNTTVYTHTAYDTSYTTEQEDYLANTDTVITNLEDKVMTVYTASNTKGNKAIYNFSLPEKTIAWSYYIGVNKPGLDAYQEAAKKITSNSSSALAKFPSYGPIAAVAMGGASYISKLEAGEDIDYWIVDGDNNVGLFSSGQPFRYIKKGKAINDYSRMENRKGNLNFCFSNDNATEPVTVTVKITTIQVNPVLTSRPVQRMHTIPKSEMYL